MIIFSPKVENRRVERVTPEDTVINSDALSTVIRNPNQSKTVARKSKYDKVNKTITEKLSNTKSNVNKEGSNARTLEAGEALPNDVMVSMVSNLSQRLEPNRSGQTPVKNVTKENQAEASVGQSSRLDHANLLRQLVYLIYSCS